MISLFCRRINLLVLLAIFLSIGFPKLLPAENAKYSALFYQPDAVMRQRLGDVHALAQFLANVGKKCEASFTSSQPEAFDVVIVVKPGGKSRVWFCSSLPNFLPDRTKLKAAIEAERAPSVKEGPVAVALMFDLNGFKRKTQSDGKPVAPIPEEWRAKGRELKKNLLIPDGVIPLVWPDDSATGVVQSGSSASTELVTQVLEPTGGKIPRPKDWFYTERHNGSSYTWILSREDPTTGSYTTGVRIQVFSDIRKGAGKSGEQFISDFLNARKHEAAKVLMTCPEQNQGMFTRRCLETEDGIYHFLYSTFWMTGKQDIVVIMTAGTTKELWDFYSPIFDEMSKFKLIDMNRFTK